MTTATATASKGKFHGAAYDLQAMPAGVVARTEDNGSDLDCLKWSGKKPIPAIGATVKINFNQFGTGRVVSYFWEHGYFGCRVKLDSDPAWHVKQCRGTKNAGHCLAFGLELD